MNVTLHASTCHHTQKHNAYIQKCDMRASHIVFTCNRARVAHCHYTHSNIMQTRALHKLHIKYYFSSCFERWWYKWWTFSVRIITIVVLCVIILFTFISLSQSARKHQANWRSVQQHVHESEKCVCTRMWTWLFRLLVKCALYLACSASSTLYVWYRYVCEKCMCVHTLVCIYLCLCGTLCKRVYACMRARLHMIVSEWVWVYLCTLVRVYVYFRYFRELCACVYVYAFPWIAPLRYL